MKKNHAPLQDSVRRYIREISIAMFLQIQLDIYTWFLENRVTKTCQSLALTGNLLALVT